MKITRRLRNLFHLFVDEAALDDNRERSIALETYYGILVGLEKCCWDPLLFSVAQRLIDEGDFSKAERALVNRILNREKERRLPGNLTEVEKMFTMIEYNRKGCTGQIEEEALERAFEKLRENNYEVPGLKIL